MNHAKSILVILALVVSASTIANAADDFIIERDVASATSDKLTIQQLSSNSRQVAIIAIRLLCGAAVTSVNVTLDRDGTAATGVTEITPVAVTSGSSAVARFKVWGNSNNTAGVSIIAAKPMVCGDWRKVDDLDSLVLTRNGTIYNYSIYMTTGSATPTRLAYQVKVRQQ